MLALAWGAAWLAWRIAWSIGSGPAWTSWLLLVVEIGGWLGLALLVTALWSRPTADAPDGASLVDAAATDVEVVVRVLGRSGPHLRATLLALDHRLPVRVIDLGDDPATAAIAAEHGVRVVRPDDVDDLAGLRTAAASSATAVLLLDAGDVPHPLAVPELLAHLEPDVAVVQGASMWWVDDSAEHDALQRHQREFEHHVLNPALGARGSAVFTGTGALIRVRALRTVHSGPTIGPVATAVVTSVLLQDGWRIVAPDGPAVVAIHPELSIDAAERLQAGWASAARLAIFDRDGALGHNDLGWHQRLGLLAWSTRPLAGIRRTVLVGVVGATLLSGALPGRFEARAVLALWLPWFLLAPLALGVLSRGTIRPGDRARQPFRTLGSAWRGAVQADGRHRPPRLVVAGAFGLRHSVAPSAAVAVISVMLALRGWSDRFTHTLHRMRSPEMAAVVLVALWLLWAALDALRMLARRTRARSATRVATSLPCRWNDRAGLVIDLTPSGAGILVEADAVDAAGIGIGSEVILDVVLPTTTGCTSASIRGSVRHAHAEPSGEQRLGIEFGPTTTWVADALAEHCLVEPARQAWRIGRRPERTEPPHGPSSGAPWLDATTPASRASRRLGLRAAALIAVAGAIATTAPGAAEAATTVQRVVAGKVVIPAAADDVDPTGTTVTVSCSTDAGGDGRLGTSDDTIASSSSATIDERGRFDVEVSGLACWATFDAGPAVLFRSPSGELATRIGPLVVDLHHRALPAPTVVGGDHTTTHGSGTLPGGSGGTTATSAVARLDGRSIPRRFAPEPAADELADAGGRMPAVLTSGVVLVSVLIGASVLVGSMLPGRRRRPGPADPVGADRDPAWDPASDPAWDAAPTEPSPDGSTAQSASPDFAMR